MRAAELLAEDRQPGGVVEASPSTPNTHVSIPA
jgi:hypothetical protein